MEINNYLVHVLPVLFIELLAATVGTYYLKRIKPEKGDIVFVALLWFVFIVELIAEYSPIAYFSDYEYFEFVKGTVIETNTWMYNLSLLITFIVLFNYFKWKLIENKLIKLINILIWIFAISCILNLVISGIFFSLVSVYTLLAGTLLLLLIIGIFQLQLLNSDEILNFSGILPFYVSIGATVLNLCLVPFAIYGKYWASSISPEFIAFRSNALLIVNLLVYSIYIFGFIICLKKKSY